MADSSSVFKILEEQLKEVDLLFEEADFTESQKFEEWKSTTDGMLLRLFGEKSKDYRDIAEINYWPNVNSSDDDPEYHHYKKESYQVGLKQAQARLRSIIKILKTVGMPEKKPLVQKEGTSYIFSPIIHNSNSQQQSQTQTVNLSQAIKEALDVVDNNYGSENAEKARSLLEELEKEPKKWENARKVVKYFADLGRDAFIAVAPVLASTVLKTP